MINLIYKTIAKPILFSIDPEKVHEKTIEIGERLGKNAISRSALSKIYDYENEMLRQNILNISFKNPIGLAAGFDKNARLMNILPSIGFGFMEIGSITNRPCEGNEKPRLVRMPKSRAILVNYGLRNNGCDEILERIKKTRCAIPVGVNLARTNSSDIKGKEAGINDYVEGLKKILDSGFGDYITINISCPNSFDNEIFSDVKLFNELFNELDKISRSKPIFVKMPCYEDENRIDKLLEAASRHKINGIIISNLNKNRSNPLINRKDLELISEKNGGISGRPTFTQSNRLITLAYKNYGKRFIIIGCGGIFSAQDAYEKIKRGASLVQLITGMIYNGPGVIRRINKGLADLMKKDGFNNINEVIGTKT